MTDVTALGELLIDFTENGISEQGNPILEANQEAHHVMCWQCLPNLEIKHYLSEKLEMTVWERC